MKYFIITFIFALGSLSYAAVDCPFVQGDGACSSADMAEDRCVSVASILGSGETVNKPVETESVE